MVVAINERKAFKTTVICAKKCTVKLMGKFQLSQQKRIFRAAEAEAIFCTKLQLLYARNVSPDID